MVKTQGSFCANEWFVLRQYSRVLPAQICVLDALNIVLGVVKVKGSFCKKKCFARDTHPIFPGLLPCKLVRSCEPGTSTTVT